MKYLYFSPQLFNTNVTCQHCVYDIISSVVAKLRTPAQSIHGDL